MITNLVYLLAYLSGISQPLIRPQQMTLYWYYLKPLLSQNSPQVGHSGGEEEDGEVLNESRLPNYRDEWFLLATALDRLAACAFLATFVITLIAFIAPLWVDLLSIFILLFIFSSLNNKL